MKTFICSLAALLCFTLSFAQGDSTFKKNEFSANLLPVLIGVSGGVPNYSKYNILYRRNVDKRWSLRISPAVVLRNNWNYYTMLNYNILSYSDSVQVREYSQTTSSPEARLNMGLEYNWGARKCTWYTGADIFFAYSVNENSRFSQVWELDSGMTAASGMQHWTPSDDPIATITWEKEYNYGIGLSPFIGLKIPFNKRFGMQLQSGFDFTYRYTDSDALFPNPSADMNYVSYNFELGGLINEVALRFRF